MALIWLDFLGCRNSCRNWVISSCWNQLPSHEFFRMIWTWQGSKGPQDGKGVEASCCTAHKCRSLCRGWRSQTNLLYTFVFLFLFLSVFNFFHSFRLIRNVGPSGFRLLDALPLWAWKTLMHRPGRSAPCIAMPFVVFRVAASMVERIGCRESGLWRRIRCRGSHRKWCCRPSFADAAEHDETHWIYRLKLCMEVQKENPVVTFSLKWICIAAASLLLLP